tara:strand:- start:1043 stop:1402 length:360 start_codon:yes stop_codon:yes gene_type:complete
MEATMKSMSSTEKPKMPSITELINNTPSLEKYIIASILTKCGRPDQYEGKYKFIIYKDWIGNNRQFGRVNFYHRKFCKQKSESIMAITSYFVKVGIRDISISYPEKSKQDLFIVFPTAG